jgi:hypothetical protein
MIVQSSAPDTPVLLEASGWLDDILIRICIALQLTPTQYEDARAHYHAVARWLAADSSPLARVNQEIFPQGSLQIGTTVRPWWREEYDLDLVLWLELLTEIDPVQVLNIVERRLRENSTYAPIIERKNRCIRLNFAKRFHLDILPARPDLRLRGTHILVPDRAARCWKESNPKGYARWFAERGELMQKFSLAEKRAAAVQPLPLPEEASEKNSLQLATQLLKRWRDIHFATELELAPISIVLTTLAGFHYLGERHPFEALCSIVNAINLSIPAVGRLKVCNPANRLEDLSERWDTEPRAYRLFVKGMGELGEKLDQLRGTQGLPSRTKQLEGLFGEALAQSAVKRQAKALDEVQKAGNLGVARTGALTIITSAGSVPVRPHTFYGA